MAKKLIDLTEAIVTVPAGWTATAGFGEFKINCKLSVIEQDVTYNYTDVELLSIGYDAWENGMFDKGYEPEENSIALLSIDESIENPEYGDGYSYINSIGNWSTTITITDGTDTTNQDLIQWFIDNNATIEGGVWEETEENSDSSASVAVEYNGQIIATLDKNGQFVILKCKDLTFEDDLKISLKVELEPYDGTVEITGGEETPTGLIGTRWTWKEFDEDELKQYLIENGVEGTDSRDQPEWGLYYNINFTSDKIDADGNGVYTFDQLVFLATNDGNINFDELPMYGGVYYLQDGYMVFGDDTDEQGNYDTFTITGGEDVDNPKLLEMLQKYAIKE